MCPQVGQVTEVWECEKIVVMLWHWEHLTSKKKLLGVCTSFLSLCMCSSAMGSAFKRSISILTVMVWQIYLIIKTSPPSLLYSYH